MKTQLSLTVNAKTVAAAVDTRTCLVDFLRDNLKLTGAHVGCRTGHCGACTVILNGQTVKSCSILAADADGQEIITIEALSTTLQDLHPVQQEFIAHQGLQCGFCTPGMILSVLQLLSENPNPTEERFGLALLAICVDVQATISSWTRFMRRRVASPARELRCIRSLQIRSV